jgi:hypothetical protein
MTNQQQTELVALVENGSRASGVGYYYSACVMFRYPKKIGRVCADLWGFALIGKFPGNALEKYEEVFNALPESNPLCLRMLYAVAQLLGLTSNWQELVEIHYACNGSDYKKDDLKEFKKIVPGVDRLSWARETMADTLKQYEEQVAQMAVSAVQPTQIQ